MKNQRKVELRKMKQNLEMQLRNIVHESKKPAHYRRQYGDISQEDLSQNSGKLKHLRLELENLDVAAHVHSKLSSQKPGQRAISYMSPSKQEDDDDYTTETAGSRTVTKKPPAKEKLSQRPERRNSIATLATPTNAGRLPAPQGSRNEKSTKTLGAILPNGNYHHYKQVSKLSLKEIEEKQIIAMKQYSSGLRSTTSLSSIVSAGDGKGVRKGDNFKTLPQTHKKMQSI